MRPTPQPVPAETPARPRHLLHTALLGASLLLIPLLLGVLFVLLFHALTPARTPPHTAHAAVTNRLHNAAAVTNLADLFALRRDARREGLATDEVDLRIWAAHAAAPALLFRVQPPAADQRWNWHVTRDGRHALAVSSGADALGCRRVGLFDLVADAWLWTNTLPWPDLHEAPYVFGGHTVLRYAKNAARFALELNPEGKIVSIDKLPTRSAALSPSAPPLARPDIPGSPVAAHGGVFFVTDPASNALAGFAQERLPGLSYAGKGDDNTLFSGNGLLKFAAGGGRITVSDSLTQTVLQDLPAWPQATNTLVTATLVTRDGSGLNVFLRTDFGGTPPVSREWCVTVATYSGTVLPSFNADALVAKPRRTRQTQALSRDSRWQLSVTASNDLVIAAAPHMREVARVPLGQLLGLSKPFSHLAFLEDGRHVVLRNGDNVWLLDFDAALGYAGLLDRLCAAAAAAQQPLPTPAVALPEEDPYWEGEPPQNLPPPALFALRAELCARHQAWPAAAALLETCADVSAFDSRAPRVNPLLLARAYLLSGQTQKARQTCREALRSLLADRSDYNRMIRYQLQGLLFASP